METVSPSKMFNCSMDDSVIPTTVCPSLVASSYRNTDNVFLDEDDKIAWDKSLLLSLEEEDTDDDDLVDDFFFFFGADDDDDEDVDSVLAVDDDGFDFFFFFLLPLDDGFFAASVMYYIICCRVCMGRERSEERLERDFEKVFCVHISFIQTGRYEYPTLWLTCSSACRRELQ